MSYDDGEEEEFVSADLIRLSSQTKSAPQNFQENDKVEARFGGGEQWFPGTVTCALGNGTYDVRYDDGDKESGVSAVNLRTRLAASSSEQIAERPFALEESVKVRYKGGRTQYPGKIHRIRVNGTYDIFYADGDMEEYVTVDMISKLEEKKSVSFGLEKNEVNPVPNSEDSLGKTPAKQSVADVVLAALKASKEGSAVNGIENSSFYSQKDDSQSRMEFEKENALALAAGMTWEQWNDRRVQEEKRASLEKLTMCVTCSQKMQEVKVWSLGLSAWTCCCQLHKGHNYFKDENFFACENMWQCRYAVCKNCYTGQFTSRIVLDSRVGADYLGQGRFERGVVVFVHDDNTYDIKYDNGAYEYRLSGDRVLPLSVALWKNMKGALFKEALRRKSTVISSASDNKVNDPSPKVTGPNIVTVPQVKTNDLAQDYENLLANDLAQDYENLLATPSECGGEHSSHLKIDKIVCRMNKKTTDLSSKYSVSFGFGEPVHRSDEYYSSDSAGNVTIPLLGFNYPCTPDIIQDQLFVISLFCGDQSIGTSEIALFDDIQSLDETQYLEVGFELNNGDITNPEIVGKAMLSANWLP